MIDTDKYEEFENAMNEGRIERVHCLWALAEVIRLREENETLRKMDWEYECLWTWLAENTNLLNTIEPLMEEWKKEYDEE
jgi:hypothetical protein